MMQPSHTPASRTKDELTAVVTRLQLDAFRLSWKCLDDLRARQPGSAPLLQFEGLMEGHRAYLAGDVDPYTVSGLEHLRVRMIQRQAGVDSVVLSPTDHPHARVVVVRCMDNRNTCANVELNLAPNDVCEIASAGHMLEKKDLESIAVGVGAKGAKVVLLEAHGGICGAIKLTMDEITSGSFRHDVSRSIAGGLGDYKGADSPEIFAGTIENLNAQLHSVFDPSLNIPLLQGATGKASFAELVDAGACVILGVYVDYEIRQAANGSAGLAKRLTFLDSVETYQRFVSRKIDLYVEAQRQRS